MCIENKIIKIINKIASAIETILILTEVFDFLISYIDQKKNKLASFKYTPNIKFKSQRVKLEIEYPFNNFIFSKIPFRLRESLRLVALVAKYQDVKIR